MSFVECVAMWSLLSIRQLYMTRLVVKNKYKHETCYNEVGLCVQNSDTILSSIMHTIRKVNMIKLKENLYIDLL